MCLWWVNHRITQPTVSKNKACCWSLRWRWPLAAAADHSLLLVQCVCAGEGTEMCQQLTTRSSCFQCWLCWLVWRWWWASYWEDYLLYWRTTTCRKLPSFTELRQSTHVSSVHFCVTCRQHRHRLYLVPRRSELTHATTLYAYTSTQPFRSSFDLRCLQKCKEIMDILKQLALKSFDQSCYLGTSAVVRN